LDACNAHDFERMMTFDTSPMMVNGVAMDPAAVVAQFQPIVAGFPDWHWDLRNIAIDGDLVVLRFDVTGTHDGTSAGIPATGRKVTISEFTLYRVHDGKFTEVWDLADMDAAIHQIQP
jgi:predicted ester cyclase